jgi:hypothetical protein
VSNTADEKLPPDTVSNSLLLPRSLLLDTTSSPSTPLGTPANVTVTGPDTDETGPTRDDDTAAPSTHVPLFKHGSD